MFRNLENSVLINRKTKINFEILKEKIWKCLGNFSGFSVVWESRKFSNPKRESQKIRIFFDFFFREIFQDLSVVWESRKFSNPERTLGDFRNISTISIFLLAVAPYNLYNFDAKMV